MTLRLSDVRGASRSNPLWLTLTQRALVVLLSQPGPILQALAVI